MKLPVAPQSMMEYEFGEDGPPNDLVILEEASPKNMLACLLQRYVVDEIYTWVGASHSVLVSINPFKQLPTYTIENMQEFRKQSLEEVPPHTFAIAKRAYQHASLDRHSQAILISGESGAGKTECTKQCLAYLAEAAGGENNLEENILNANPVLEAFGNAKTVNNNNSSRFGKWMVVGFNWDGKICNAQIEPYMLEASRVPSQAVGERSYHIFYQLLAATSSEFEDVELLGLESTSTTDFLGSCRSVEGIDDQDDFRDTCSALASLGFSTDDRAWIFKIIAAILHLGTLKFKRGEGDEGSFIDDASITELEKIAELLQVNPSQLSAALCERHLLVQGERQVISLSLEQALETRDTMAKQLYARLFHWLVQQINSSIVGETSKLFIGILDIFGFEIFTKNSFEQLCINFCNEKLQQTFNKHTFKEEIETYKAEGVPFDNVPFIDNQPVLDLLEKKPMGVLLLLDEEVRAPKGTDSRWLSKCDQGNKDHKAWSRKPKRGGQSVMGGDAADLYFTVTHYAGDVQYDGTGFVEKNRDAALRCIAELMQKAGAPRSKELFPKNYMFNAQRVATTGETFRRQLKELIEVLQNCEQNYIRCVKPNQAKRPQQFESIIVNEQLTYSGVYDAVKIRKAGYPYRMDICKFWAKYRCLRCCVKPMVKVTDPTDPRQSLVELFEALPAHDLDGLCYGKSKVFFHAHEHKALNSLRSQCFKGIVPIAQRAIRKMIGRCFLRDLRLANKHLQQGLQEQTIDKVEMQYESSVALLAKHTSFEYIPHWRQKLQAHMDKLNAARDKVLVKAQLVKALDSGNMEEHEKLLRRLKGLDLQPVVKEAMETLEIHLLESVVHQAEFADIKLEGIDECKRLLELPENELVSLQLKSATERKDARRIHNCQFRLRRLHVEANLEPLVFQNHPDLRGAQEWAAIRNFVGKSMVIMSRKKLSESYLSFSKTPIHATLTKMSKGEKNTRRALNAFQAIMAYMGDRHIPYPEIQVAEAVNMARKQLGTEIYLQVMKQLTNNPNEASRKRGWEVLMLLINNAPPEKKDQDYIAAFVIEHSPSLAIEKNLVSMILGPDRFPTELDPDTIPELLEKICDRRISRRFTKKDIGVTMVDGTQVTKLSKKLTSMLV